MPCHLLSQDGQRVTGPQLYKQGSFRMIHRNAFGLPSAAPRGLEAQRALGREKGCCLDPGLGPVGLEMVLLFQGLC